MKKRWRLALIFPLIVALGGCLGPGAIISPEDDEPGDKDEDPTGNAAIVLVQNLA